VIALFDAGVTADCVVILSSPSTLAKVVMLLDTSVVEMLLSVEDEACPVFGSEEILKTTV